MMALLLPVATNDGDFLVLVIAIVACVLLAALLHGGRR